MSTHKNIDKICIVVLVLTLLLTMVFMNGEKLGIRFIADEDAESYSGTSYFTEKDQDGNWTDNVYTTYITLNGTDGKIVGTGAYFLNGNLVIASAGWYDLSGTLDDGSIIVDTYDSSKVWLRLNGITVNCSDDACLRVEQADKVFLTLAEGTKNSVTSGSIYSEVALSDNTGGTIFSHDDLTINGSGSLSITARYKHGIDANDSLVITGGTITITAPEDGIHVNDSFRFMAASLTIDAGDDAVHSDGSLYVESGRILINSCYEGLEAITIDIAGGDITIYPSDDGLNANGRFGGIEIDEIQSDSGERPTLPEEIEIPPGSDMRDQRNTHQMASYQEAGETETYIRITGGTITIINETGHDADGLDSNGNIYIDGGELRISLRGDSGNTAIDYGSESGGECIVTGGTILACGCSSMVEEFSSSSTQCAVLYSLDSIVSVENAEFSIMDKDGTEPDESGRYEMGERPSQGRSNDSDRPTPPEQ